MELPLLDRFESSMLRASSWICGGIGGRSSANNTDLIRQTQQLRGLVPNAVATRVPVVTANLIFNLMKPGPTGVRAVS